ncbi:thioesterase family protein [Phaeobacter sp. HF9A]|uniref:acyl-CoA thioesterase n=1 Tax=Phaeobacter sp. HF9A TaxID=2721561 RepID=UPI001430D01E|nr:thioesterase family protein [Phaeobacter sp. HF9A]NIZ12055.1 hypothetical protein [Phaeobacter sp. HF9A]
MTQTSTAAAFPQPIQRREIPFPDWSYAHVFRHGECDPAGIVYTPAFFNVFNRAIEAWFCECLGLSYYDFLGPRRIGLGYVNAHAEFFSPVKMGQKVDYFIRVTRIGGKSYALELNAMLGDTEALRGLFTTVTTDLDTHSSINIPTDLRDALNRYVFSDNA